ncbi:NAD(P)/FAD-dependent oxidoreductase [Salinibacterium sp. ZJ70]|uniref:protoporphyrinogen/coproporphyrinogen oxidase n=1 Tax=Salinibacterium sp. ZJ70 TaxID=2708084 RepID=UPI00141EC6EC|nr:FAD-dependent oxidoreductase [Salinibacterium sp. ZJ70]
MPAAEATRPVIVVGGGIAGLVVARELVLAGREVVLLEKSDRLGGQVAKHSVAGIELDAGAEAFSTRGTAIPELLTSLGLADDVVRPSGDSAWVHRAHRGAVPLPATSLLGIPAVPLAADVIAAIGMGGALRAQMDALLPSFVGGKATSLGDLVRRRMGRAVHDELVAPVVRGVHSLTPDELPIDRAHPRLAASLVAAGSLAHAVRRLRGDAPGGTLVATLRGGLFRLADALESEMHRFGVDVRTRTEVVELDAEGVTTATGERIEGEVLLAAAGGTGVPRTRVQIATLALDAPQLASAPRGTGVLVGAGVTDVAARALTHVTAKWPWLAESTPLQVLRLSYDAGIEVTPERARADAEVLLGQPIPAPVDSAIVAWERAGRRMDSSHAIDGMHCVGEAESGTGLAAVVALAREVGRRNPPVPADPDG